MRTLLGMSLMALVSGGLLAADEKIDAKKLIGKWEQEADKDKKRPKVVVEFAAEGKMAGTVVIGEGKEFNFEGTYKLDGNKLTQMIKLNDKDNVRTVTITKLTDDVMEGENEKGDKNIFKRVKPKKDK